MRSAETAMQLTEAGNAVCYERWINKAKMDKIF